jgi:hypothetical protein
MVVLERRRAREWYPMIQVAEVEVVVGALLERPGMEGFPVMMAAVVEGVSWKI